MSANLPGHDDRTDVILVFLEGFVGMVLLAIAFYLMGRVAF